MRDSAAAFVLKLFRFFRFPEGKETKSETLVKCEVRCGGCVVAGRLGHGNVLFPMEIPKNRKKLKSEHRGQARMPQKGLAMKRCISLWKSKKFEKYEV